jgi:nicotinate-nucleotide adenylyltransferase
MVMRLGIFGGTFDPPHIGHQILAAEAYDQLNLDKVLWVLTPNPPHKNDQEITSLEARLKMVKASIAENERFELSRVEMDRHPPHYSVDTLRILAERDPSAELIYLVGSDSLIDLHTWHNPDEFVAACDGIGVMCRPGEELELRKLEEQTPGISAKLLFIDAPLLEISSTEIRSRIVKGLTYRYYLPEVVYRIIEDDRLYRREAVIHPG